MKIVINRCFGGFRLSKEAVLRYGELKGITLYYEMDDHGFVDMYYTKPKNERVDENDGFFYEGYEIERNDPALVQVVEELGKAANGQHAKLKIVEVPDDVNYEIHDYDGRESVHEVHRVWS